MRATSRRAWFGCATALLVAATVELVAYLGLGIVAENWFAPGRLQQVRLERLAGTERSSEPVYRPTPAWVQNAAIHPFVGFVEDPSTSPWNITDFGFYETERPLYRRSDDRVILGVFGGSFAYQFRENAIQVVVDALQRDPRFAGREVVVTSTALGGYKQPQQLMALNWLLALGGEFDIVLNIDGFNEVALYAAENRAAGVFPAYPRSWYFHTLDIGDGGFIDRAATVRRLKRDLARVDAFHSRAPWRWSASANLLWTFRDRRLRARLADAEERLLRYEGGARYVATGPAFDPSDDDNVYSTLVDIWKNSSLQMARLCRANGIVYVHALQPNQYVAGSKPLSEEERRRFYRADHPYREGVERGYPRLREAGRELTEKGVRFVDLTMLYADVEDTIYADDCCHVNERGYLLAAEPMTRALLEETGR